jgi:hypothetical protein
MLDVGGGGGRGLMGDFLGSSTSGSFAVNDTGGAALLTAIREMARWVDDNAGALRVLAQQPPLGTSVGANAMKPHVESVATDQEGFLTMLMEFRRSLTDAEQGVLNAMANYREQDSGTAQQYT